MRAPPKVPTVVEIDTIDFRCGAYDWPFARDEKRRIDENWDRRAAAQSSLFDGLVYLASNVEVDLAARHLRATAFETRYRNFLAWRDFGFPGEGAYNLFAMAALQSADGAFLVGEMGPNTATAGLVYFPAGTPDPADESSGTVDLDRSAWRELQEETGFAPEDLAIPKGWRVVFDGARIACMKEMRSPLPASTLIELFLDGEREPELSALLPITSLDGLDMSRAPSFMLTYLRDRFGATR